MKTIMIYPARGHVIDPATGRPLPAGKATKVPQTSYWTRRLRSGDVTTTAPPESEPAGTEAVETTSKRRASKKTTKRGSKAR